MNWIQREVLVKFLFTDRAALKDLKPDNVDANLFSYHLNKLISDGLIVKSSRNNYQLTLQGKHTAGLISKTNGKLTRQPKIAVMIYARNDKNEYLMFKWRRQPYLNQVSLPYGKLHFEDSPIEAVQSELCEKTGLRGELSFKKDVYVKVIEDDLTLTHMLVHVFEAKNLVGKLIENSSGRPFWSKLEPKLACVPGFDDLLKHIESNSKDLVEIVARA